MKSAESITPQIAVVLSNVEYHNLPFGHLHQLDKIGISNIYILLNEDEFQKANTNKSVLFDHTEPKTIIEHYQSQSSRLKIQVVNTGAATTEEEKLHFYLENIQEQYALNLFVCNESMPWVNEELSARPPVVETTEYSFIIPFFRSTAPKMMPFFDAPCSSEKVIELLQREINPCFCYKKAHFDVLHYQWLFNIFVEIITLKLNSTGNASSELSQELSKLIKDYNKNIIALEKAEESFEKTHKEAYKTLDEPSAILRWQHARNVKARETLDNNFPKLISQLIKLYGELLVPQNNYTPPN